MRRNGLFRLFAAVAVVLFVGASTAQAATLQIQFSGLDLVYTGDANSGTLCDATSCNGGINSFADADPLVTMSFLVDGVSVGTLTTNIAADIGLAFTSGLSTGNPGTATGGSGIFDLMTQAAGWGLALNITDASLIWMGNQLQLFGSGSVGSIEAQALPFGLVMGMPISFSFSTQDVTGSTTTSGGFVTSVTTAGTGEVKGQSVPEPASVLLLGLGLLAGGRAFRRRNQ